MSRYAILPDQLLVNPTLLNLMTDGPALEIQPLKLKKRAQFFLEEMIAAGAAGITSIDYPGVRVANGIFKLGKAGVAVETIYESHDGEYAGRHALYVLTSTVVRLGTTSSPTPTSSSSHQGVAQVAHG